MRIELTIQYHIIILEALLKIINFYLTIYISITNKIRQMLSKYATHLSNRIQPSIIYTRLLYNLIIYM